MIRLIFLAEFVKNTGGMLQSLTSLIKGLSKEPSFEILLISPANSEISSQGFSGNVKCVTTVDSSWHIKKGSLISAVRTANEIWNIVKKDGKKPTIWISNNVGASIMISLMPTFSLNEIYVCRGGTFKGMGGGLFMKNKIHWGIIKHIIVTSSHLKEQIAQFSYPLNKISIIYNGLELPTIDYSFSALSKEKLMMSTIGYISVGKNQMVGIKTLYLLRKIGINAYYNIYGEVFTEADKQYLLLLEKQICKLGLQDYVSFKGFVKGEELFQETDLLVSFSNSEGFGRTIVEAMLRKKPIIAYRGAGGPVDITLNGKYGILVDNNNPEDYCKAIESLIGNPRITCKMVNESFDYAIKNFTEERMVKAYIDFFKSLDSICK